MYYSEEDINNILSKNDIVEIIGKHVSLLKKSEKYIGCCPFHSQRIPTFIVDEAKQFFYCPECGRGGNVVNFFMELYQISFLEAINRLSEIRIEIKDCETNLKHAILEINKRAAHFYQKNLEKYECVREYIKKRQLDDVTIQKFEIGFSGELSTSLYSILRRDGFSDMEIKESGLIGFYESGALDKFANRLMFPIRDVNGNYIGFGGRILRENKQRKEAKYLNSPETLIFEKSENLFGLNFAKESPFEYLILCEGYMDVISMHQAGFTNAVASLGTALTEGQARLIKKYRDRVVLSYDSDGPGLMAAQRAIPILSSQNIDIHFLDLKPYKDPDELIKNSGKEVFQDRISHVLTKEEWLFKQAYESGNTDLIL